MNNEMQDGYTLQECAPGFAASEDLNCLVCGGQYHEHKFPGLFKCGNCGFISADLRIPDEELHALYGEDYFHGEEYLDYIAEGDSLRLNFAKRIDTLKKLVSDMKDRELFEIGCAYGFFLKEVAPHVKRARGMDISADAVTSAVSSLGVDAQYGDYLNHQLDRQVDIITMWDTIEHLKRPDLFVAKAARDLKPGGHIAVTTGDIGALNARLRGKSWRMIHPPTHMHYFSTDTMKRLLDRNGFDIVHVSHPGNSRRLRSVLYFLIALKGGRPQLYERLQKNRIFDIDLTVNLFDIMFVVGKKRA